MMISKGITLLEQTWISNDDIREWRRQTTDQKTWGKYKIFFHRVHREKRITLTTTGKGGYTAMVQNIYGAPPPPPEEHHHTIEEIQTIVQGM